MTERQNTSPGSDHRAKAVEAGVEAWHETDGLLDEEVAAILDAAEPHLQRMYFERFREAVYQEMTGEFGPDHLLIAALDRAETKAQELMEEETGG